MKITIQPTERDAKPVHNSVVIQSPNDDLTVDEAVGMARSALIAWGFSESLVDQLIQAANPCLIAAAPDMLEALELVDQDSKTAHGLIWADVLLVVRQAIAKAKGDTP